MRKIKLILTVLIALTLIFTINANECFFKTSNESCQRISTGYNTFQLDDLSTNSEFVKYEVQIYNKQNIENQLNFELEQFNINQLTPFLESGVYVIKVKAYLRNNDYVEKKFEYIYDNTDLMPPIIPVNLISSSNSFTFQGKAIPNTKIIAIYNDLEREAQVDENGLFTMNLNSLNQGINYVKFYSQKDETKSQIVERVLLTENLIPKVSNDVASINIDNLVDLNERTLSINNVIYTGKRNFYVEGKISSFSDTSGEIIFVNGQKTLADSSGKFGTFVLLNDGVNQVLVESGTKKASYNVNYVELEFQFLNLEYDKLVAENKVNIKGKTNFDYPFQVYLNGNYYGEFTSNNKEFEFSIIELVEGKNFIELRGLNNEVYDLIVYYDTKMPEATILSQINLAKADKLVFEIDDDLGINLNSVQLKIGDKILSGDYFEVKDNLFLFDISSTIKEFKSYEFTLTGEDLVGKKFSQTGIININLENTLIEDIYFDGTLIGNKMFVKSGTQTFNLIPSRNIAFKSIFLDGVEQTNYEILRSGKVRLNLDINKKKGTIHLNFINKNYEEFTEVYNYFSDNEKPVLKLDYIKDSFTTNKVKISGEIEDSNFDWNSFKLNDQNAFIRFGRYFEALIDVENTGKNNLEVKAYDYSKNSLTQNFGSILFKDNTNTNLVKDKGVVFANESLSGSLYETDESVGNYNFVDSFDGFKFNKLYLSSDNFELPLRETYGIRAFNLEGFEESNNEFNSLEIFKVELKDDYSNVNFEENPVIYFSGLNSKTKNNKIAIQGYIKTNKLNSASISGGNGGSCQVYDNSFVCIGNLNNGINTFNINIQDSNGKVATKSTNIEKLNSNLNVEISEILGKGIFESNGAYYMIDKDVNLKAILSNKANIELLIDGKESFIGEKQGAFSLDLASNLESTTKTIEEKEINLQLKAKDENGFESFSNIVKVIYKRVFETFASVKVD